MQFSLKSPHSRQAQLADALKRQLHLQTNLQATGITVDKSSSYFKN
jgi:hypothetical protein